MIRNQNHVPEVYVEESRDFQLFLRLMDYSLNPSIFDASTIPNILNTEKIKNNLLPLLATKLGFFTNKKFLDTELRYILCGFSDLLRNKGSLKAVKQAINLYCKLYDITGEVEVYITKGEMPVLGFEVKNRTILVGINDSAKITDVLDEIFKYILPAGFGYYFYFYSKAEENTALKFKDNVKLLFVSNNINSQVFSTYNTSEYGIKSPNEDYPIVNAVDTIELINSNQYYLDTDPYGRYMFLGIKETLPTSAEEGNL